jgi:DNA-binding XRE family transcriptional regulator
VKTHHTEIHIKGKISEALAALIRSEYGDLAEIENDELIDPFSTDWYKKTKTEIMPGDIMRIDRQNKGLSQKTLGEKLGRFSRQNVSDMENGRKNISLNTARKLAEIFKKPVSRYI